MPGRLASISSNPTLREYAQGAAQSAIQPAADFLAPPVEVATTTGQYKAYNEKNRFHIPDARRAIGGRATELRFEADDRTYNCQPHALDFPVDHLEQLEATELESVMMEGAQAVAEVGALSHEKAVIDHALDTMGAGTNVDVTVANSDLVDVIDEKILNVIKAAKYGSLMGVGVLFGATGFRRFKNHPSVQSRFNAGSGRGKASTSIQTVNPSIDDVMSLLIGNPQTRISYMVHDTKGPGEAEDTQFLLDNSVLIFARLENPTRRDPSFMKTFRLRGQWMVPGSYTRDDGRVEVAKFDWSEDIQVTNSQAGLRLNFTTS